jgi:hypothetical protein
MIEGYILVHNPNLEFQAILPQILVSQTRTSLRVLFYSYIDVYQAGSHQPWVPIFLLAKQLQCFTATFHAKMYFAISTIH